MSKVIRSFRRGFMMGIVKSVDIGNTYKSKEIRIARGENINKSWEHTGEAIRRSIENQKKSLSA